MGRYPLSWELFVGVSRALLAGERSLAADARVLVAGIEPPPVIEGVELVPRAGPVLLAANHYHRHGLWIGFPGAVISLALAEHRGQDPPVHWLTTGGLRLLQPWDRGPELPYTRWFLGRIAAMYGMTALPLGNAGARAGALHTWLGRLDQGRVLGYFPEGLAGRDTGLTHPQPSSRGLMRRLRHTHIPVTPVAIWEAEELRVRFGPPMEAELDEVMAALAELLPAQLRGVYRGEGHGALG